MTVAPLTPQTIVYEIFEVGNLVGSVPATNMRDALRDWAAFLEDDYTDIRIGGNFISCLYDGSPRTFIARAEQ